MYEILIPLLTFTATVAIGGAVIISRAARRKELQARLQEHGDDAVSHKLHAGRAGLIRVLRRIGTAVSYGGPSPNLKEQLTKAGYHGSTAAPVYLGAKILLLLTGMFGACALLLIWRVRVLWCVPLSLMAGALVSFLPNIVVALRRRKRSTNVRHHLPDAVDLLEICVSSGMGMDMAWNVIADEIRRVSSVLADEMALTNLEIHLGSPRTAAMRHLAERTGVEDIQSLVAVLTQSERFGTSIADALRVFSSSMREARSTRAQEEAERMAVRLLFPMILFIFPAVLIVLVGPAGIKLAKIISGT
jgi:tight adherence protein C